MARTALAWIRATCLVCALALVARADDVSVDDSDGHFTAVFPGPVQKSSQPAGASVLHIINFDESDSVSYFVMWGDQPAGTWARVGGVEAAYKVAANRAMKSQGGTLRLEGACSNFNTSGREYIIDIPDKKLVCRVRYFIVGDRFYQDMYVGPPGTEFTPKTNAFLDSFRQTLR